MDLMVMGMCGSAGLYDEWIKVYESFQQLTD
jgi:hypothetical protein